MVNKKTWAILTQSCKEIITDYEVYNSSQMKLFNYTYGKSSIFEQLIDCNSINIS